MPAFFRQLSNTEGVFFFLLTYHVEIFFLLIDFIWLKIGTILTLVKKKYTLAHF